MVDTKPSILLAVDFSPASAIALDACVPLAMQLKATVVLLHALPSPAVPATARRAAEQASGPSRLASEWSETLARTGLHVEVALHAGSAPQVILEEARRRDVAMIMMGTAGASGLRGWIVGSVAKEVLRASRIPVLVMPLRMQKTPHRKPKPARCIVAAVDFSEDGEPAFEAAVRLARDLHCALRLVHVVDIPTYSAADLSPDFLVQWDETAAADLALLASRARQESVGAVPMVHWGHPASAILAEAKSQDAELIVVGTHGKSGLRRFLLGSVAQSIVQMADRPVLVVPDPAGQASGIWWR